MTNALQNLPPELQARLAAVLASKQQENPSLQASANAAAQMQQSQPPAQQVAPTPPVQQAPPAPVKPPSLIDILLVLRQEVATLHQEVQALNAQVSAASQVNEAVGHAVGRMYQMFQPSEQAAANPTYSQNFQTQPVAEDSDY